ncbi:MAG: methyltransferase [Promicromonosporaceae bacterium]|nr:methyltransferase [Promicromonosporaceae bacterium]
MLLTISTTHQPATDLGYLLHKHPDRVQQFSLSYGEATVFYPEANARRCTVALVLEVDNLALVRKSKQSPDFALSQYVNDRSYAASSFLAAALSDVFRTARSGKATGHQELADSALPLEINIPVLPCKSPSQAHEYFEPLGWAVNALPITLNPNFPEWGGAPYVNLTLIGEMRLADALNQLRVLIPALAGAKHYYQNREEIDKLLASGGAWLQNPPARAEITRQYFGPLREYTNEALNRLAAQDEAPNFASPSGGGCPPFEPAGGTRERPNFASPSGGGGTRERDGRGSDTEPLDLQGQPINPTPKPLREHRYQAVLEALKNSGASSVIDLGCGEGRFLVELVRDPLFTKITGTDVSTKALNIAARRLNLDEADTRKAERINLFQGALTYEDARFAGYDAAVLIEVIEHLDESRVPAVEQVVFGAARPGVVVVTTPNKTFNAHFGLDDEHRHTDHRFEWDRARFADWANQVGERWGYRVKFTDIGTAVDGLAPTQMAVFQRVSEAVQSESGPDHD